MFKTLLRETPKQKFIEIRKEFGKPGNIIAVEPKGTMIPNFNGCLWLIVKKPISQQTSFGIYTALLLDEFLKTGRKEWDLGQKDEVVCSIQINKLLSFDIKLNLLS
jgi:hypothetical protein